mmetsp:Transcript_32911/g.58982  ORF Transcript_32911/g.58982 Transcript_32911/m.58982 type:complete len:209 (+) Transcript_32911:374-1000(+)
MGSLGAGREASTSQCLGRGSGQWAVGRRLQGGTGQGPFRLPFPPLVARPVRTADMVANASAPQPTRGPGSNPGLNPLGNGAELAIALMVADGKWGLGTCWARDPMDLLGWGWRARRAPCAPVPRRRVPNVAGGVATLVKEYFPLINNMNTTQTDDPHTLDHGTPHRVTNDRTCWSLIVHASYYRHRARYCRPPLGGAGGCGSDPPAPL